jgi:hypothetical protein
MSYLDFQFRWMKSIRPAVQAGGRRPSPQQVAEYFPENRDASLASSLLPPKTKT